MIRKNLPLFVGIVLTALIAAVCLTVPGVALKYERSRDVGQVHQAQQEYYADDVLVDEEKSITFIQKVMMVEGRWKCEKTQEDSEQHVLLKKRNLVQGVMNFLEKTISGDIFLESGLPEKLEQMMTLLLKQIWTSQGEEISDEEYEYGMSEADQAVIELFADPVLYQYTDRILGTYSFYAWEIHIDYESLGIKADFIIDAITLDVYKMSIGGRAMEAFPWEDYFKILEEELRREASGENGSKYRNSVFVGGDKGLLASPDLQGMDILTFLTANNMIVNQYIQYITEMMAEDGTNNDISGDVLNSCIFNSVFSRTGGDGDMIVSDVTNGCVKFAFNLQTIYAVLELENGLNFYFTTQEPV